MFCDGEQVCRHPQSCARADVPLLPAHARELRLAREAKQALAAGDVTVDAAPLTAYEALTELAVPSTSRAELTHLAARWLVRSAHRAVTAPVSLAPSDS